MFDSDTRGCGWPKECVLGQRWITEDGTIWCVTHMSPGCIETTRSDPNQPELIHEWPSSTAFIRTCRAYLGRFLVPVPPCIPQPPPPEEVRIHVSYGSNGEKRFPVSITRKAKKHPRLVASLRVKEESNADPYADAEPDIHTLARYTLARIDEDGSVVTLLHGRETWGHDALCAIDAARGLLELELEGILDAAQEVYFRARQRLPLRATKDRALRAVLQIGPWNEERGPFELRRYGGVTLYTATFTLLDREGRNLLECSNILGMPLVGAVQEAQECVSTELSYILARADDGYFTTLLSPVQVTPSEVDMQSAPKDGGAT